MYHKGTTDIRYDMKLSLADPGEGGAPPPNGREFFMPKTLKIGLSFSGDGEQSPTCGRPGTRW